ncbi:argininosuccinate synthase domain-containing protein [Bacteroidota bacterium]
MNNKVVLAFSGGLDTSFCVKYLSIEKDLEVYSVIANSGGFDDDELKDIEKRARELGVKEHVTIDITNDYYTKCVRYMVFGNVLRNNTYPLSVSSERTFQAIAVIEYAKKIGAQYVAHGSTGAGNDQVRFDLVFQVLAPDIEILTPIRELQLTRQQEIDYLKNNGVQANWDKMAYSVNKGVWGTSVGGKETLTSNQALPEEAYPNQLQERDEQDIILHFEKGELVGINNELFEPWDAISNLEAICSRFAIGRDIHVGDTIIGIKGRVGFEAAAAIITIKAHHLLEKHTLTKWQMHWKEQLGNWYGMFLHESFYLEPVMRNIEKFLEDTQKYVTGKVFITLKPYRFELKGIESAYDLMSSDFAEYGEMNKAYSGEDVKGFTRILSNSLRLYDLITHEIERQFSR